MDPSELLFEPRNDTIIIQRLEVGQTGRLMRPATAKTEYELYALVLAIGPKVDKDLGPLDDRRLKVGDRVLGLFAGAVPAHTELPVYAISDDAVLTIVRGGEGVCVPTPKEGRLVVPPPGSQVASKRL